VVEILFAINDKNALMKRGVFCSTVDGPPRTLSRPDALTELRGTGKGGMWLEKPSDAESAIGARIPKVWSNACTACPDALPGFGARGVRRAPAQSETLSVYAFA
jgi:hypothetical protein